MIAYKRKPKVSLPPGPAPKGVLGNTKAFKEERFEMMRHCVEDYDGIVFTRIAFRNVYVVSKPAFVQQVLQKNAKNYHKSANYEGLRPILGKGLLTNEGESWFAQRKLMQPAFHRDALSKMVEIMDGRIMETISKWQSDNASTVDVGQEMRGVASDIVTRCLFGMDANEQTAEVGQLLAVLLEYANDKMVNPFKLGLKVPTASNKRVISAIAQLDQIVMDIVARRRVSHDHHNDLLQMLLDAKDAETGQGMNDQQLRDELMTLYLAGQETTQHALTFTMHLLMGHPKVVQWLEEEINGLKQINLETLHHLPRLVATIQESLRLFPPIWAVSRRAVKEDHMGDYTIPEDATVFIPIWAIHRSSKHWKSSEQFRPDRFMDQGVVHNRYVFFPFGAGPRVCIGNHFALMEMQVVLIRLLQHFEFRLVHERPLEMVTNMTMRPKYPVLAKLNKIT